MKKYVIMGVVFCFLCACSFTRPEVKILQEKAGREGLVEIKKSRFEASFSVSSEVLSSYKLLRIDPLDLEKVNIIQPEKLSLSDPDWVLSDSDRRYYQEKYRASAQKYLLDSELFSPASDDNAQTLYLKTRLVEIAPLASKDEAKSRVDMRKIYSEGFGRITIAFELYDAATQKLVATALDTHELGRFWEENNRIQNNRQINIAFEYWMHNYADDLASVLQR